jgi:hypothetical protein
MEKITMKISVSRKLGLVIAANTIRSNCNTNHNAITDSLEITATPPTRRAYPNRSNGLAGSGQMDGGNVRFGSKAGIKGSAECPLYPQKQTLIECAEMSAMCQKRT